jgi:hypothetical protein
VALYGKLGRNYSATRRADPRIATIIGAALADNKTVINIGAGTGSYEQSRLSRRSSLARS